MIRAKTCFNVAALFIHDVTEIHGITPSTRLMEGDMKPILVMLLGMP